MASISELIERGFMTWAKDVNRALQESTSGEVAGTITLPPLTATEEPPEREVIVREVVKTVVKERDKPIHVTSRKAVLVGVACLVVACCLSAGSFYSIGRCCAENPCEYFRKATAKIPGNCGGWGQGLPTTQADLATLRRATREDWPVPAKVREAIVAEL